MSAQRSCVNGLKIESIAVTGKRIEKVQIMLSEEELTALDNWRFQMRMPSRAATVRQLLLMAMKLDVNEIDFDQDNSTISSRDVGMISSEISMTNEYNERNSKKKEK